MIKSQFVTIDNSDEINILIDDIKSGKYEDGYMDTTNKLLTLVNSSSITTYHYQNKDSSVIEPLYYLLYVLKREKISEDFSYYALNKLTLVKTNDYKEMRNNWHDTKLEKGIIYSLSSLIAIIIFKYSLSAILSAITLGLLEELLYDTPNLIKDFVAMFFPLPDVNKLSEVEEEKIVYDEIIKLYPYLSITNYVYYCEIINSIISSLNSNNIGTSLDQIKQLEQELKNNCSLNNKYYLKTI